MTTKIQQAIQSIRLKAQETICADPTCDYCGVDIRTPNDECELHQAHQARIAHHDRIETKMKLNSESEN